MTKEVIRDSYGLRTGAKARARPPRHIFRTDEEFQKAAKKCEKLNELRRKTKPLRDAMDLNYFMLVSLDRISRVIANDCSAVTVVPGPAPLTAFNEDADNISVLERELVQVEQRLHHIGSENESLQTLLRRVNLVQSTTTPREVWEDQIDAILYRYHSMSSRSERHKKLGIVCPGWRKGESADTKCTEAHVRQHLTKDDTSSPPFISVSESPGRAYRIMLADRLHRSGPGKIFIISRRMLQKSAVNFWPSTTIVRDFGLETHSSKKPKGLHYVTESHILVHRWIPEECIECEMSEDEFEILCATQFVTTEHPVVYDNIDVKKRICLKDLLEFKSLSIASKKIFVGFADEDTPDHAHGRQPNIEDKLDELALA